MRRRGRALRCATVAALLGLLEGMALSPALPAAAAAPAARSLPTAVAAVEGLTFHHLVTSLSAGPVTGDLALGFADGAGAVVLAGRETVRLPQAPAGALPPSWVPGSDWVVYAEAGNAGTSDHATAPVHYALVAAAGSPAVPLPACADTSGVQALQRAVAWWCASSFYVLTLPTTGTPDPAAASVYPAARPAGFPADTPRAGLFAYTPAPSPRLAAVPGASSQAVVYDVRARQWNGTVQSQATPFALRWSPRGVLAEADAQGVTLWRPGDLAPPRFTATDLQRAQWLPGGSGLLVLDRVNPGQLPAAFSVDIFGATGSLRRLMAGSFGYVLGFSAGGRWLWREEGVAAGVYASGAAGAGSGPFRLNAVPVPHRAMPWTVPPSARSASGAAGTLNFTSVRMVNAADGWATDGARIYRTTDGGAHWTDVTPTAPLLGGDNWQLRALGAGSALAVAMAFNGGQGSTVDGIFVTSDGGATWQRPTGPFRHLTAYTVTALDARHLWAWRLGPNASLQLEATADGGSRWSAVAAQGLPAGGAVDHLAFVSATRGWAAGAGGAGVGPWPWLAVTRDGGRIWTRVPLPPVHDGASVETGAPAIPVCFAGGTCAVRVSLGATTVVDRSTNGGASWRATAPPPMPRGAQPDFVLAGARHWYALAGGALYATSDGGGHWSRVTVSGIALSQATSNAALTFAGAADGWLTLTDPYTGTASLWRTTDGGQTWTPAYPATPPPARQDQAGPPVGAGPRMVSARQGWWIGDSALLRTTDGGQTWTEASPPDLGTSGSLGSAYTVATQGTNAAWVALQYPAAPPAVWRTTDGGAEWQKAVVPGLPSGAVPFSLAFSGPRHGWLAVQANACAPSAASPLLYTTSDGGATWTRLPLGKNSSPLPSFGGPMVFATATTGFDLGSRPLVTRDGGRTWRPLVLPVPAALGLGGGGASLSVGYVRFFTPTDGVLTASAGPALVAYRTTDGGRTWTPGAPLFDPSFPGGGWGGVSFADMLHGWVTDGTYIAVTADGGASWRLQASEPSLAALYVSGISLGALNFVSPLLGWAAVGGGARVLATTDGGASWRVLDAQFQGLGWADVSAPQGGACGG